MKKSGWIDGWPWCGNCGTNIRYEGLQEIDGVPYCYPWCVPQTELAPDLPDTSG